MRFDTLLRRQVEHREDLLLVAVHAPRTEQAEDMQRAGGGLRRGASLQQCGVVEKAAVRDGGVDTRQVLVDDAAGADVHVADFGVAHLAVRQADVQAMGLDQRMRIVGQQLAPVRQVGQRQRVAGLVLAIAPAIENQQQHRFGSGHGGYLGKSVNGNGIWPQTGRRRCAPGSPRYGVDRG